MATGQNINAKTKSISRVNNIKNKIIPIIIIGNLITIPIAIENQINPSRYSFFIGLKKVFIKSGVDSCSKKALFKEKKYRRISLGDSINQNLR